MVKTFADRKTATVRIKILLKLATVWRNLDCPTIVRQSLSLAPVYQRSPFFAPRSSSVLPSAMSRRNHLDRRSSTANAVFKPPRTRSVLPSLCETARRHAGGGVTRRRGKAGRCLYQKSSPVSGSLRWSRVAFRCSAAGKRRHPPCGLCRKEGTTT